MPPAIYRTGLLIAHVCLNGIALVCLVTLLMIGSPTSYTWQKGDELTEKLKSLINEETSSPIEFLQALGGEKIVEDHSQSSSYSTGRKHFYVKDWKLVELKWEVTLKQLQLDADCLSYELRFMHSVEEMNLWQAIERLLPNGYSRYINQSIGSSQVSFPVVR